MLLLQREMNKDCAIQGMECNSPDTEPDAGETGEDKDMTDVDGDEKENQDDAGHPVMAADAAVVLKTRIPGVKGRAVLGPADSDSRGAGPDQGGKRKRLKA